MKTEFDHYYDKYTDAVVEQNQILRRRACSALQDKFYRSCRVLTQSIIQSVVSTQGQGRLVGPDLEGARAADDAANQRMYELGDFHLQLYKIMLAGTAATSDHFAFLGREMKIGPEELAKLQLDYKKGHEVNDEKGYGSVEGAIWNEIVRPRYFKKYPGRALGFAKQDQASSPTHST